MDIGKVFDQKYVYQNTVWDPDGTAHACFAYFRDSDTDKTWYELPLVMSQDDATKWLELIRKDIDFEYTFIDHDKGPRVRIWPPKKDFNFIILFGNLTKGVSEFAWFCEDHINDEEPLEFFTKNRKHFEKYSSTTKMQVEYHTAHGWWSYRAEENEHTAHSIKDLFINLEERQPDWRVWPTCLKGYK